MIRTLILILLAAAGLFLSGGPARADAIDGAWCRGLQQMAVNGPEIVTAGGHRVTAAYDRHRIEYTVPEGEPGAGATVIMTVQHDALAYRYLSTKPDLVESWERCRRQIS